MCGLWLGLLLSMTCPGATVRGASDVEGLPKPKGVVVESPPQAETVLLPGYYRISRYDVWQFYGVDRRGGFRPRVVYSPYGPYVLYNGAPYPFAPMHSLDFMPYVVE
jgi:hypothetical protein